MEIKINFCDIAYDVTLDSDYNPTHIWPSDVNHTDGGNLLPMINECFAPESRMFLKNCIDNAVKTSAEKRWRDGVEQILNDDNNKFHTQTEGF